MSVAGQIGHYALVRELARGGMGVVYEAYDTRLERRVAIKTIRAERRTQKSIQRFLREARAVATLQHPHIVRVYDVGEVRGVWYMVMDLVDGKPLTSRLARDGAIPWREAATLCAKVARALAYAHDNRILHRDVKPANVLVTREGEPRLTDFGVAKIPTVASTVGDELSGESRPSDEALQMSGCLGASLTMEGALVGTPFYMPPEHADGRGKEADIASDIYSLGASLYELLTGEPPFNATSLMNLLTAIIQRAPVPPSVRRPDLDLDPEVEAICLRCIEKDPADRFASAAELAEALEACVDPTQRRAPPRRRTASSSRVRAAVKRSRTRAEPPPLEVRTSSSAALWAVGLLVALLGLGGLIYSGRTQSSPQPTSPDTASTATPAPSSTPLTGSTPPPTPTPPTPTPPTSRSPRPRPASGLSVTRWQAKARQLLGQKRATEALGTLDDAIREHGEDLSLRIERAHVRASLNNPGGALTDMHVAVGIASESVPVRLLRIAIAQKARRFDLAIADLTWIASRGDGACELRSQIPMGGGVMRPHTLHVYFDRGECYRAINDPQRARADHERCLKALPRVHPLRAVLSKRLGLPSNRLKATRMFGRQAGQRFAAAAPGDRPITRVWLRADATRVHGLALAWGKARSRWHGRQGGRLIDLKLRPNERIRAIAGRFKGQLGLIAISIVTTERTLGPFGSASKTGGSFRLEAKSGQEVVGLCGMASERINALGLVVRQP